MGSLLDYGKIPKGGADMTPLVPDTDPRGKSSDDFQQLLYEQREAKEAEESYWEDMANENDFGYTNYLGKSIAQESLTANLFGQLEDAAAEFDATYDPTPLIVDEWPDWRKEAVMEAKNDKHAQLLIQRTEEQDLYNKEGQYHGGMGTALNLLGAVANPENYILGAGEVAALTKLGLATGGRIAVGAGLGALTNTGIEAAVIANNKSRERLGLLTAAGFGAAFGAVGGLMTPRTLGLDQEANAAFGKAFSNTWKRDLDMATGDIRPDTMMFKSPGAKLWDDAVDSGTAGVDVDGGYVVQLGDTAGKYNTREQALAALRLRDKNIEPTPKAIKEELDLEYRDMVDQYDKQFPRRKGGKWSSIGLEGRSSKNPIERMLYSITTEDASGTGGKNVANASGALRADVYAMQMRSAWHPVRHQMSKAWMKENKIRNWKPWDTSHMDRFDDAVVAEIGYRRLPDTRPKGAAPSKTITQAADAYQELQSLRLKRLKESGVTGYDTDELDNLYVKHKWDGVAMTRMTEKHGKDFVIDLLARGIMNGKEFGRPRYKKMGDKLTEQFKQRTSRNMAHAIYSRFTKRPDTHNLAKASHITKADRRELEERLRRVVSDSADVKHVMASFDGKDSKVVNDLLRQIDIDINFTSRGMPVRNLLDTNLGSTIDTEIRRSAGKSAMADMGFSDRDAFMTQAEAANRWNRENIKGADLKTLERKADKNFNLWSLMMGENLEANPKAMTAGFARGWRKATTLTALNQVGFAQLAEMGRLTGAIGVQSMMKEIPKFNKMIRSMKTGKFKDPILNDIESAFGIRLGDNEILNHPQLMAESGGLGISAKTQKGFFEGMDKAMNKGLHVQGWINGMNAIMKAQHRMHARGFFMRMYDDLGKAKISSKRLKRYAEMGFAEDDLKAFKNQFDKNVEMGEGWFGQQRPVNFNLAKMDPGVREKMLMGFWRNQNNAIQRNIGGETAWWMESTTGKLFSQFRSFPLVAIEKQTLRDIKHFDAESAITLMAGMSFAALAFTAKTYANSFGLPAKKRKQYLKNRLNASKIAAGAAQWAGQFSIFPDVMSYGGDIGWDNPFTYTHQKGMAYRDYYRDQGLNVSKFMPGYSMIDNAYRFTKGVGQVPLTDKELFRWDTWKNATRLAPFSNSLFVKTLTNTLEE